MIELLLIFLVIFSLVMYNKIASEFKQNRSEIEKLKRKIDKILINKESVTPQEELSANALQPEAITEEQATFLETDTPLVVAEETSYFKTRDEAAAKLAKTIEPEVVQQLPLEVEEEEQTVEPVPQPKRSNRNYEKIIGSNLFGKIGIIIFVIGIGLFVKHAISENWITEVERTVLGFLVGSCLLFIAERLHKKYRTFSSLLAGGAFAVFYLIIAVAFHYYQLFTQPVAFALLVGVTVLMSILSVLYDRRELAAVSLVGGFIAPFLASSGEGSYVVLFTYLMILNIGMFGLSVYKKWAELVVISFAFTYIIMGLYLRNSVLMYDTDALEHPTMFRNLLIFASLFYIIFLLPIVHLLKNQCDRMSKVLLSLVVSNSFIYLGFGVFFLDQMMLPFKASGLLSLFVALLNVSLAFFLRKRKEENRLLSYTILGLVLTFVSITVPLQLEGHYITLFWSSEMVLLLWLYLKSRVRMYESASLILLGLTLFSFFIDMLQQTGTFDAESLLFFNTIYITNLYTGLMAATFAYLLASNRDFFATSRCLTYKPWNAIMSIAAAFIIYYSFVNELYMHLRPSVIADKIVLIFSVVSILVLSFMARNRFPITNNVTIYTLSLGVSVFLFIINCFCTSSDYDVWFNLISWLMVVVVAANLYFTGRMFYRVYGIARRFTVYINILASLLLVAVCYSILEQLDMEDEFGTALSIALGVAGFIQMGLGMRLKIKLLRVISLVTFGIVLSKLILIDLWAMATVGKIVVFVILGVMLLVLSFFYQKKNDTLYDDDDTK
jgi:uncharacterized membrane protein